MNFIFYIIATVLLLSACVTGPNTEKKHTLDVLNGENYDVGPSGPAEVILIPVVKSKQRESQVVGQVVILSRGAPTPLRYVSVGLYDTQNRLVTQASTDSDGKFILRATILNGEYQLRLTSEKYSGSQSVSIKDYSTSGIMITAQQIPAQTH